MVWWQLVLFLVLFSAAYAGYSSAPWVPTRRAELSLLLNKLPRRPTDTVVDLGAGTGTLLFALAKAGHTGQLIGYEISVGPYLFSLCRKALGWRRYRHIVLRYRSLWTADLQHTQLVLCFLLPSSYSRLTPWLRACVPAGTTVVVQAWPLPDWPHDVLRAEHTLPWFLHRVQ
jgi:SAM-dependent methyltransferase